MTREQAKAIFPDATDEQLNNIMNLNGTDINNAKKNKISDDEITSLRNKAKQFDDEQVNRLSVEEKAKQLLADAERIKVENTKILNRTKAVSVLVAGGMVEADYQDILNGIVSDNEETTLAMANHMVKLIQSQKNATEKKVKEDLLKNTPPPAGGSGNPDNKETSKEEFTKMNYGEREKLLTDNPDLYSKLTES